MRVGIVTQPLKTNYGGLLQCYALQTTIENNGSHDVDVLVMQEYGWQYYLILPFAYIKRLIRKYLFHKQITVIKSPYQNHARKTEEFIRRYIHTEKIRNWKHFRIRNYDAIIAGSDQIWRPEYSDPIEHYFLDFACNSSIEKISYAASFGTDTCPLNQEQLRVCVPLLKQFRAVSVREHSGVKICREQFCIDAQQMPDPTLLLDKNDYDRLINGAETEPSGGDLMTYILDETEEKTDFIRRFAAETGMEPFRFRNEDFLNDDISVQDKVHPSVEQWMRGFRDASFVITDSFHGCVFSIIFHKQFIAIGNKERGLDRFVSLLEKFGLSDRLILSLSDFQNDLARKEIDYDRVDRILENEKKRGKTFLHSYLNL